MSRDPRDAADAAEAERPDDAERSDDAELLAAYVDGGDELAPDERARIEAALARDPALVADETATRGLIGQLRALPPEGTEPDWAAMARSIRHAVADEPIRPWWRRWQWLVPLTTCAAAAALAFALWPRTPDVAAPPAPVATVQPPVTPAPAPAPPADEVVALWLDGAEVDVAASASDLLADPAPLDEAEIDEVALLPAASLGWVDGLDDDAMARAEQWLDGRKKG